MFVLASGCCLADREFDDPTLPAYAGPHKHFFSRFLPVAARKNEALRGNGQFEPPLRMVAITGFLTVLQMPSPPRSDDENTFSAGTACGHSSYFLLSSECDFRHGACTNQKRPDRLVEAAVGCSHGWRTVSPRFAHGNPVRAEPRRRSAGLPRPLDVGRRDAPPKASTRQRFSHPPHANNANQRTPIEALRSPAEGFSSFYRGFAFVRAGCGLVRKAPRNDGRRKASRI